MDSNGTLMWSLTTDSGRLVTERDCLWPQLPNDLVIRRLEYDKNVLQGFKAYGFQRYLVNAVGGDDLGHGVQLIAVKKNGSVQIIDIDHTRGQRRVWTIPESELTYDKRLLRQGRE